LGLSDRAKRKRLERDGFLFEVSHKLRGIVPDWYQTAFHTQEYVRQMLEAQGFLILSYELGGLGFHDVVLATRLPDGETSERLTASAIAQP